MRKVGILCLIAFLLVGCKNTVTNKQKEKVEEGVKESVSEKNEDKENTKAQQEETPSIKKEDKESTTSLTVKKDEQKPIFVSFLKEVHLPVGSSEKDLLQSFLAVDEKDGKKESVNVYVEGSIQYTKSGRYDVMISCKDSSGNKTSQKCTVWIEEIKPPLIDAPSSDEKEDVPEINEEEGVVYVLPENYISEDGTHYEYFWSEEEVKARFNGLKDARYHKNYFDDYETFYYELMWYE